MSESLSNCKSCGKTQCGDGSALKKCSRCHSVAYCGGDCQKNDWKTHKPNCKPVANNTANNNAQAEAAKIKQQLSQFVNFDEGSQVEGSDHGHSHNNSHQHSHGGKPCGGHGPAPAQEHSHAPQQHQHSHGGKPCGGHGGGGHGAHGGPQQQLTAQQMEMMQRYFQQQQLLMQQQKAGGGGHGHSHGGVPCGGHGQPAAAASHDDEGESDEDDHGHSHSDHNHSHSHGSDHSHGHNHSHGSSSQTSGARVELLDDNDQSAVADSVASLKIGNSKVAVLNKDSNININISTTIKDINISPQLKIYKLQYSAHVEKRPINGLTPPTLAIIPLTIDSTLDISGNDCKLRAQACEVCEAVKSNELTAEDKQDFIKHHVDPAKTVDQAFIQKKLVDHHDKKNSNNDVKQYPDVILECHTFTESMELTIPKFDQQITSILSKRKGKSGNKFDDTNQQKAEFPELKPVDLVSVLQIIASIRIPKTNKVVNYRFEFVSPQSRLNTPINLWQYGLDVVFSFIKSLNPQSNNNNNNNTISDKLSNKLNELFVSDVNSLFPYHVQLWTTRCEWRGAPSPQLLGSEPSLTGEQEEKQDRDIQVEQHLANEMLGNIWKLYGIKQMGCNVLLPGHANVTLTSWENEEKKLKQNAKDAIPFYRYLLI